MATTDYLSDPELLATEWDLSPLVDGDDASAVEPMFDEASDRASEFATRYAGRVGELDAAGLAEAMHELAAISDLVGRAGSYAALRFSTDTADPARGALLQRMQERSTEIETKLLFFDLEWAELDDERVDSLLGEAELDFCRHHLRSLRRYRPHLLSESEEKLLAEKSISSQSAWGRLFSELCSALRVSLDGEEVPLDVALSRLQSPDRAKRRAAAEAVSATLEPGLRTRGFIYNTLAYDKSVEDRLRAYPHWLAARNLANEASDESVMALIEAVRGRYDIPQRWYALKAKLLGVERLADYDRSAPVLAEDLAFSYAESRELVLDTYRSFSDEAGRVVARFFDENWIDAPVRPHKRGGAFCSYTVPSVHPYVLLNFTARRRDVLTMAHELGHGLHAALAQPQGIFHHSTPLTLAETASVFGETLVFERLLDEASDGDERLGLLAERIDGEIATVFRQMAMNRFEHLVHTNRRARGRALGRPDVRVLGGEPARAVRRLGGDHRGLPHVVVLRPALHQHARLRLRLRLRATAGAVGLQPLPQRGRVVRPALPRTARRRRVAQPRGTRRDHRHRPHRPGLLGRRAAARRRAAERGRGARRRPRLVVRRPARARALLLALDHVGDQLQHLFDARRLGVAVDERVPPVAHVALGGELVEMRA